MFGSEREMLDKHGVVVMPDEIDHEAFKMVLGACLVRPDQPITLYCRGDGGDSCSALAIVDVIRRHGQVVGLLPGEANSAHSIVWAACAQRYVFDGGVIGLHRCARTELKHVDAGYARRAALEFDRIDRSCARVLASACTDQKNHSEEFWYKVLDVTSSRGFTCYEAPFLIEIGMALPIAALDQKVQS